MIQHLSIRVPWHDGGWNGCVCKNPNYNQACRVLRNIALSRSDQSQPQCSSFAGERLPSDDKFVPPCLTESGMFMSTHEMHDVHTHPYSKYPDYHKHHIHFKHVLDTTVRIEPFSFIATPYKWTLKADALDSPNSKFYTKYDPTIEIDIGSGNWISNGKNQKRIFDYFYKDVMPNESIAVAYAKAVPFIESSGRVVIGIGFVSSVEDQKEYDYSEPPTSKMMTAMLWERNIGHTIRANRQNGFLFPFTEIQAYLAENPMQNPDELVVIAPEEYRNEFSYATEHLSHDALIQTLNKTIQVFKKYIEIRLPCSNSASWSECIAWCELRLKDIWVDRGAYPGLGAVLSAMGVPYGFDVAHALKNKYSDNELWDSIADALGNLAKLMPPKQKDIAIKLTKTKWADIADDIEERQSYLELLSRISLTLPQALFLLDDAVRSNRKIKYADMLTDIHKRDFSKEINQNPYALYEKTYRLEPQYRIGISQIDIAMFPPDYVANKFYLTNDENRVNEPDDQRRLRAIIISILEYEATNGSSLMLAGDIVSAVGRFRSDVPNIEPSIRLKTIKRLSDYFAPYFVALDVKVISESNEEREESALQLARLKEVGNVIRHFVDSRIGKLVNIKSNWAELLSQTLSDEKKSDAKREKAARAEKVEAIKKMAQSRISVLTGGAGTGKTTTLVALCMNESVKNGGILVLAPTGKARVVISSKLYKQEIEHSPKTIFQYLQSTNHCDAQTWSYYLSGKSDNSVPETVIIDECSMLTEEMFGACLEAIAKAKRVILVGDPNQLPPIGTGKPFYELVQKLKIQEGQPHYANLLISNRQKSDDDSAVRLDVELSKLFSEDLASQVGDDLFLRLTHDKDNIEFIHCDEVDNLSDVLFDALSKAINVTDIDSFDISLGGVANAEWMNFNDAKSIEDWQILSPYRNKEIIGTRAINATIQREYRLSGGKSRYKKRKTDKPLGVDGVLFGEKVINLINDTRNWGVFSPFNFSMDDCQKYIANGEVGIVTGFKKLGNSDTHIVQFSTQDGYAYNFNSGASENESPLELAYALTVHKAQGSGFKITVFVLIEPERGLNPIVTREMLYTALTRQSDKVFIVYNKEPSEIKKYINAELSDLAHRKTNLFCQTVLRELKSGWYDSNLIHKTKDGTQVRSKSEVIVYNMLLDAGHNPIYEKKLVLNDGINVLPDFTLDTEKGTVYWEHLGMLGDYNYRMDWERKQKTYAENGITIENGKLIVSKDELSGAIDTQMIDQLIVKKLPKP
jgi:hypothetical protein